MDAFQSMLEAADAALKPGHKDLFKDTTRDDFLRAVATIELQRDRSRTLINMKRLDYFVKGSEGLCNALEAAAIPQKDKVMSSFWGFAKYLIHRTNVSEKAFDNLLDVYESIGVHMPNLERLEWIQAFPDTQECVESIYHIFHQFHMLAYELFSLRPSLWTTLQHSIWKHRKPTFAYFEAAMASNKRFVDALMGLVDTGTMHFAPIVEDVPKYQSILISYRVEKRKRLDDFESQEMADKRDQRSAVKRWIAASTKLSGIHHKAKEAPLDPESGAWLFKKYRRLSDWMEMEDEEVTESAIWLHGKTGYGKTVLAALIIERLKSFRVPELNRHVLPRNTQVCYFYCQEDDNEHRSYLDILRGLLSQMSQSDDYLLPLCRYRSHDGSEGLFDVNMAESLLEAFIEHSSRTYIVIDGLSECEKIESTKTIEFFNKQVMNRNQLRPGVLRVLFVGRRSSVFIRAFDTDDAVIELQPGDNAQDIKKFVRRKIEAFSDTTPGRRWFNLLPAQEAQIQQLICHQSQDMFLFATLSMDFLSQMNTKEDLLTNIKEEIFPTSLPEIYDKLLESVRSRFTNTSDWETAKRLLGWLVCAKRPLQWREMQSMISFDVEGGRFDLDGKMLRHDVQKYAGSLVEILDGGHIRLIHPTARRYMFNGKHIDENEAQCQLICLCLKFLSLPYFTRGYGESARLKNAGHGCFSMQDYVCSHWHRHLLTFLESCNVQDPRTLRQISDALEAFAASHGSDLAKELHEHLGRDEVDRFSGLPFHENLLKIWNQVVTHQKNKDEKVRNTVGISQIDKGLLQNRAVLEKNFGPKTKVVGEDIIEDYYGPNLFKCHRTLCRFFHVGYREEADRDTHLRRHDRPYSCPAKCQWAPDGFVNEKDVEKHVRKYHPDLSERSALFKPPTEEKPRDYACHICSKRFTRKENRKSCERVHNGERPYKCSKCPAKFTRMQECRRHERNNVCQR